ncbi:MAG: DUF533 domain-containing protein [Deltaproteobacteria bacterium]|jgi:uncharacterized membrane protein YebE (DUF533 family)|nr:DUF533 domain-containing protein [Deltaproteobacteria bacterium]
MNLLQNLQDIIGQGLSGRSGGNAGNNAKDGGGLSNLSGLLGPAALGGLAGLLLTSKAARGTAAGALLAGGGALLWNKYKNRVQAANSGTPDYGKQVSPPDLRAERLVRAMVFAAKSDGHIDDKERQAIQDNLQKLNFGPEAEALIQQAMQEPLDPMRLARDVHSAEEALEVYTLTCAVIDPDHFMELSYLDALADALHIPADVRAELTAKAGG